MAEQEISSWQRLVDLFPLNKPGANPWDANLLDKQSVGASHGERCTIQFLLNLWNADHPWQCGSFDVFDALGIWDDTSRNAFLAWAKQPWWP